jgi:hypothetical protein
MELRIADRGSRAFVAGLDTVGETLAGASGWCAREFGVRRGVFADKIGVTGAAGSKAIQS